MDRLIYMDNAATTSVKPEVLNSMLPFFTDNYANPSSIYNFAQKSKKAVEDARTTIADIIGADKPNEIYFTAGGSESDNWALKATAECFKDKGNHIITTKIEHHAILHTCEWLEKHGYEVTYLDVDSNGLVDIDEFCAAIKDTTIIASIMYANNEIGTIEPIKELGAAAHSKGVIFHTDAVQAFAHIPVNVKDMNIDMLSASGHKFHGPKGTGFLYISNSVKIGSFIHGGSQERSRRAGTLNVPGIIGMAEAARLEAMNMEKNMKYVSGMRDYIIERISADIPYSILKGDRYKRLPCNIHMSFRGAASELLLIMLDQKGICVSAGSACASGSVDPSHVLTAIGVDKNIARNSVRMTIGEDLTKEEADYVVEELKAVVERIRSMSPEYAQFMYTKNCFLCNSYIQKTAQGWRFIMKYLKQFLIILVISLIGEILNKLLPLPVPASIYGMVILFAGLLSGIIKLESVKEAGSFLIEIMPVMFIPAGVGLMSSWLNLKPVIIPVCIITVVAIFTVMLVSGHVTQYIVKHSKNKDEF